MKYFLDAARMILVSLETVYILLMFLLFASKPEFFSFLGGNLVADAAVKNWLPALPVAISAYCFINLIWKILTPLSSSNSELHEWPDFWRLKMRGYYSLALSILCAATAIVIWIFAKSFSQAWLGLIFVLALGVSLINVSCMLFASYAIRIILEPKNKEK